MVLSQTTLLEPTGGRPDLALLGSIRGALWELSGDGGPVGVCPALNLLSAQLLPSLSFPLSGILRGDLASKACLVMGTNAGWWGLRVSGPLLRGSWSETVLRLQLRVQW